VRFYLHNIFRKTNTKQQSYLVSLLKSMQPIINRDLRRAGHRYRRMIANVAPNIDRRPHLT